MIPRRNPNSWSCLLAAFATSLNYDIDYLINRIGNDGSEIIHPELEDPLNRKGFHPQQFIRVCLEDGFYVTRVELFPTAVSIKSGDEKEFDIGGWNWFKQNMFVSTGVIECRTAMGKGHAMSCEGLGDESIIYDPANGDTFIFKNPQDTECRDRFLVALWRIDT